MKVRLETREGGLVVNGRIAPFKRVPDVLTWGERTFKLKTPAASDAEPSVFVECLAVFLFDTDD